MTSLSDTWPVGMEKNRTRCFAAWDLQQKAPVCKAPPGVCNMLRWLALGCSQECDAEGSLWKAESRSKADEAMRDSLGGSSIPAMPARRCCASAAVEMRSLRVNAV